MGAPLAPSTQYNITGARTLWRIPNQRKAGIESSHGPRRYYALEQSNKLRKLPAMWKAIGKIVSWALTIHGLISIVQIPDDATQFGQTVKPFLYGPVAAWVFFLGGLGLMFWFSDAGEKLRRQCKEIIAPSTRQSAHEKMNLGPLENLRSLLDEGTNLHCHPEWKDVHAWEGSMRAWRARAKNAVELAYPESLHLFDVPTTENASERWLAEKTCEILKQVIRQQQGSSTKQQDNKDERLEELIEHSGMVRTPTEFSYWIEAISQWIYFRIGPEEFGKPYQDTLASIQADLYEVGVERSVERTVGFLKTIR